MGASHKALNIQNPSQAGPRTQGEVPSGRHCVARESSTETVDAASSAMKQSRWGHPTNRGERRGLDQGPLAMSRYGPSHETQPHGAASLSDLDKSASPPIAKTKMD